MRSVIMLLINGDKFLFEDNGYSLEQKNSIQNMADIVSKKYIQKKKSEENFCEINEEELYLNFINEVKGCLGIDLLPVKIQFIVRVKC